jgi:hypothetical protein
MLREEPQLQVLKEKCPGKYSYIGGIRNGYYTMKNIVIYTVHLILLVL